MVEIGGATCSSDQEAVADPKRRRGLAGKEEEGRKKSAWRGSEEAVVAHWWATRAPGW